MPYDGVPLMTFPGNCRSSRKMTLSETPLLCSKLMSPGILSVPHLRLSFGILMKKSEQTSTRVSSREVPSVQAWGSRGLALGVPVVLPWGEAVSLPRVREQHCVWSLARQGAGPRPSVPKCHWASITEMGLIVS